jgi:hypothetical protein
MPEMSAPFLVTRDVSVSAVSMSQYDGIEVLKREPRPAATLSAMSAMKLLI